MKGFQKFKKPTRFQEKREIGEGSYGTVYEAIDTLTQEAVAVKKVKCGDFEYGLNLSAIREIKTLQEVKHENIVNLVSVYITPPHLNLVYELMETDLEDVIKNKAYDISASDIKSFLYQLLRGLEELHKHWVLHRDLKPGNLLLSSKKPLKIADLGLAKIAGNSLVNYSPQCVTRWYRAPELLYGAKKYGFAVDVWSCGCIFAELLLRNPFFPGNNDLDQLGKIFAALGTPNNPNSPNDTEWPHVSKLEDYVQFEVFDGSPFDRMFSAASKDAIDLLSKMLILCPSKRISVEDALKHRYFKQGPKMTPFGEFKILRKK